MFNLLTFTNNSYALTREFYFFFLPSAVRYFIMNFARRDLIQTCWGQGSARYSYEDLEELVDDALTALEALLEDSKYLVRKFLSSLCTGRVLYVYGGFQTLSV